MDRKNRKIIVIALGNRLRSDDGAGPAVCDLLKTKMPDVNIDYSSGDALNLIGSWKDRDLAIIVDASVSNAEPGTISRIESTGSLVEKNFARCSTHGFGINQAITLANILNMMPGKLVFYAIEAESLESGDSLSHLVSKAISPVMERIILEISEFQNKLD